MNRKPLLLPELPPEMENRLLRQRLQALTDEVYRNEEVLRRFQQREIALLNADSLPELLTVLTDGMKESFGLHAVTLVLNDRDHELRHILLHNGTSPEDFPNIFFLDDEDEAHLSIRALRKPWLGAFLPRHAPLFPEQDGLGSIALLPVVLGNRRLGRLNLGCTDKERFTHLHASDYLSHLATIAAVCVENVANREHLLISGLTDALTGLHNRRYLKERLEQEVARACRYHHPLSCLFIDADHFKRINDRYGHEAGDCVLREISLRVRECLRASDMAARYGGEEFALLLPQTGAEEALLLAERIRQCVSDHPIPTDSGEELTVTVSVGVSQLPLDIVSNETRQQLQRRLLQEADSALYRAKEAGRNLVRFFNDQ
jgi:diguanylate cyclase (GGDEF)-like protein